ncbi:P-loop containing nucleoside triphosphate hydrolase protein [Chytriomyces cf. hyalinus JEL632]|nr:P-loop containing nucleoside triphosphate hydrolase protein [Chytriomyces cf. hyalinus JEL632]
MHSALYCDRLYRHKKIKPFKDGFAVLDSSTRRVSLLDEFKKPIDNVYMRSLDALEEDLEMEMERHFCVVAAPVPEAAGASLVTTVENSTAPAIRRPPIPKRAFHAAFKAPSMLIKKPISSMESIVPPKAHQPPLEKRAERAHVPNVSKWSIFNADEESNHEMDANENGTVEEVFEHPSDTRALSISDSTDQTVFSVQIPGKIFHSWKPPKPAFSHSALLTTTAWNTADSTVNRSFAADDARPIQSPSDPEYSNMRKECENSSEPPLRPNSPPKNFKAPSKTVSIVRKFAVFKPPSSKAASTPSAVANYKGKPTLTSRIPSKSSIFSGHIVASPPIVQIPKHSSENLYFRTSSQTQGLKKSFLKRNFIIPRSFVDPRLYTACFKSAIIEHLQLQLDSLALRFHSSGPQQHHQKQQKLVQGSRYTPRPPPTYTAALSRSLPSLIQKHVQRGSTLDGHLTLNFQPSSKPHSSQQSKHDLWIVSDSPSFDSGNVFIGVSVFYGGGFGGASVEVKPFSRADDACAAALLGGGDREVYVLYGMNVMMEMLMLENLERILGIEGDGSSDAKGALDERNDELRLLAGLLGPHAGLNPASAIGTDSTDAHQVEDGETAFKQVMQLVNDVKIEFTLNQDQAKVVEGVALSVCVKELNSSGNVQFRLVHGVFGSGKTYLIAVVVILLQRAVDLDLLAHTPDFRIAISSMSNVAVDQILQTLLSLGFQDFVRIGSLKKIAKPLLPYTLQQLKNSNDDLKELRAMLKSDSLNAAAQRGVQEAVRRFTKNENKNLLETAFLIGVTCAACSFEVLEGFEATLLVLDECSQMTEPLSLLPITRFNPSHAVLIGDPLQLSPTLETNCVTAQTSLERTLYERLASLGTPSTLLRTQYRCHPRIAQIPNRLFYGGILLHGMNTDKDEESGPYSASVRQLGPACFVDVRGAGGEKKGSGAGGSLVNYGEAEFVVKMVSGLVKESICCEQIGVITYCEFKLADYFFWYFSFCPEHSFFTDKSQAALIQSRIAADSNLSGILVSTVDSFQGGERDVILISTVRSDEFSFIDEPKRVNVSLTRARKHLVIIGNGALLSRSPVWREIVGDCDQFSEMEILEFLKLDVGPASPALDLDLHQGTSIRTKNQDRNGLRIAFGNWNSELIDSEKEASDEILYDISSEGWGQLQQEEKQLFVSDSRGLDGNHPERQYDDVDDGYGNSDAMESNGHITGEHVDSWAVFADQVDELAFEV